VKDINMKLLDRFRKKEDVTQLESKLRPLPAGARAPDFSLMADSGRQASLADFKGKPVVLVFYPEDNSPVCSSQLALYNQAMPLFHEHNAQIVGISVDDPGTHQAFSEKLNLSFPLLADNAPLGAVASAYGVFDQQAGNSGRALFVINAEGVIHWSYISPTSINPGANGILEALEELSSQSTRSSEDGHEHRTSPQTD
jgi:peroxiredoxin